MVKSDPPKNRPRPLDLIERFIIAASGVFASLAAFIELSFWFAIPVSFFLLGLSWMVLASGLSLGTRTRIREYTKWLAQQVSRNWPIPLASILWIAAAVWSWSLINPLSDPTNTLTVEWLKIIGPVGAAFFIGAGLVYTHRSSENGRKALQLQVESTKRQEDRQLEEREDARLSERNERFFKAVALLGEDGNEGGHIGALFALECLATESDEHYHQVIDAICAFVRSRSFPLVKRWKHDKEAYKDADTPHDIILAIAIIGRRRKQLGNYESTELDLRGTFLIGVDLNGGDFQGVNFSHSILFMSTFSSVNFARASFIRADLVGCKLFNCVLVGSNFSAADLTSGRVAYGGSLPSPNVLIATETQRKEGFKVLTVYGPPQFVDGVDEDVNYGRYVDHSVWNQTVVDGFAFQDFDDWRHENTPFDLSQLGFVNIGQWVEMSKPDNSIPPLGIAAAVFKLENDPTDN